MPNQTARFDGLTEGLAVKRAVRVATTANVTLSGLQTIDDIVLAADDRVLVKDQSTQAQNGIYAVSSGPWQRARDADARAILEAELRKAEARLTQLQEEYKNGEPDKQGIEGRNHQRYLDRVQALREDLARQYSDVASLKKELARLPAAATASQAGGP